MYRISYIELRICQVGRGYRGWGLSEVVTALLDAGLVLESMAEYEHCNAKVYSDMKPVGDRSWTHKDGVPKFPLMYSLSARKPAT